MVSKTPSPMIDSVRRVKNEVSGIIVFPNGSSPKEWPCHGNRGEKGEEFHLLP